MHNSPNIFTQAGVAPSTYIMDNEISHDFIEALTKKQNFVLASSFSHTSTESDGAIH